MKNKILLFTLAFLATHISDAQINHKKEGVKLLSTWSDPAVPNSTAIGNKYSSCWGYAQNGREYAIIGASTGTYIIDITNPSAPKKVGFVKGGGVKSTWREYKTYKNYLYCASDDDFVFHVVDLSYLPDSVKVVYQTAGSAHTITQDKDNLYLNTGGINETTPAGANGFAVFNLTNPQKPVYKRHIKADVPQFSYFHDSYIKNDTIYASAENSGLAVFHYDPKLNKFNLLGAMKQYPFAGYNHSSVLMRDGKTLIMLDEVPSSLPIKVVDVSNLSDIKMITTFSSSSKATPHNPFLGPNNKVVIAYYEDGVQIFDLSNPAKPVKTGYFDTHHQSTETSTNGDYRGVWSAYTELPSGRLIASDMQNGLFVLDASEAYNKTVNTKNIEHNQRISLFPNPSSSTVKIQIEHAPFEKISVKISDIQGKTWLTEGSLAPSHELNISSLPNGSYFLQCISEKGIYTAKLIVTR